MSDSTRRSEPTEPLRRHGAHRGPRGFLGALMPSVLAVAAVAALITALAVWQSDKLDQPRAAASEALQQVAGVGKDKAAETKSRVGGSPSPGPAQASTKTAPSPSPSPSTAVEDSKDVVSDLEVVVLNQTSRSGLAAQVADRLRSSGWEVPAVGNFRGVVPATTVYYPVGAETDALAAARDLPTEPRVRPRFGNLSTSRLTVVVTDSYPG